MPQHPPREEAAGASGTNYNENIMFWLTSAWIPWTSLCGKEPQMKREWAQIIRVLPQPISHTTGEGWKGGSRGLVHGHVYSWNLHQYFMDPNKYLGILCTVFGGEVHILSPPTLSPRVANTEMTHNTEALTGLELVEPTKSLSMPLASSLGFLYRCLR